VRNVTGVGRVSYEADVSGFKWADNLALGLAWRPTSSLLISYKFQWINWEAAMNSPVLNLRNGSNPLARTGTIILPYNWRNQYVNALGAYYEATDKFHVHGGYNYGNNPVPLSTMDPTNANITEHHFVGGLAYKLTPEVKFDTMVNYVLDSERTYDSTRWGGRIEKHDRRVRIDFLPQLVAAVVAILTVPCRPMPAQPVT
jgi:long-chain fatty acid transport protein